MPTPFSKLMKTVRILAAAVAALMLAALGADAGTIMEDYLLTNVFCADRIKETYQKLLEIGYSTGRAEAITEIWESAKSVMMENALASLVKSDGSAFGYLKNRLGLTDDELSVLRERYLV